MPATPALTEALALLPKMSLGKVQAANNGLSELHSFVFVAPQQAENV